MHSSSEIIELVLREHRYNRIIKYPNRPYPEKTYHYYHTITRVFIDNSNYIRIDPVFGSNFKILLGKYFLNNDGFVKRIGGQLKYDLADPEEYEIFIRMLENA